MDEIRYILDQQDIANPIELYINIIQNRVVLHATNGFEYFDTTFFITCQYQDPLTWMLAHLVILEKNNGSLRENCQAPPDWSCENCQKAFQKITAKLKKWMGEQEYKKFLRSPIIR